MSGITKPSGGGSSSWKATVPNYAALLAIPSPTDGDVVIVLDTDEEWEYDAATLMWVKIGGVVGPGGPSPGTSVVSEILYGLSPTPGVLLDYSRKDHTHGSPTAPNIRTLFTFTTGSPVDFGSLIAGDEIIDTEVTIDTTFDDPATIITIGQTSIPGNILPSNTIDPAVVGTYNNSQVFLVTAADSIRLQILPGVSTQGSGRVIVTIRRS